MNIEQQCIERQGTDHEGMGQQDMAQQGMEHQDIAHESVAHAATGCGSRIRTDSGLPPLREGDDVRVLTLEGMRCGLEDRYERAPQVGDIAVVAMLLRAPKHADGFLCECVGEDGATRWLATFPREALAPVDAAA